MKQDTQSITTIEPNDGVLLPIGEVSALTGVNAVTLKGMVAPFWLDDPARTPRDTDYIRVKYPKSTRLIHG